MSVFRLDELIQSFEVHHSDLFEAFLKIPGDLLAFDGHFPEHPVLPGVVQIQIVRELIEKKLNKQVWLRKIARGRMSVALLPNEYVRVEIKLTHLSEGTDIHWRARAHLYKNDKLATRLTLLLQDYSHPVV